MAWHITFFPLIFGVALNSALCRLIIFHQLMWNCFIPNTLPSSVWVRKYKSHPVSPWSVQQTLSVFITLKSSFFFPHNPYIKCRLLPEVQFLKFTDIHLQTLLRYILCIFLRVMGWGLVFLCLSFTTRFRSLPSNKPTSAKWLVMNINVNVQ